MSDLVREIAARQFRSIDPHIRLVVAHPNYARQRFLLTFLLENTKSVYVLLRGAELDERQLREQLDGALALQSGTLDNVDSVVLDEADRAADAGLEALAQALAGRARLLLITRRMPAFIQSNAALRQQTCFIPAEKSLMLPDYARQDGQMTLLEVHALGSGRVLLNGRRVENWDGTLPRALFFYLVDRGMTTRAQIFETFWPALSTREATNVFHVTKRKISEVLGVDLTVYWSGFYLISPTIELQYDAALFAEMVQRSAVSEAAPAADLLARALSLYQGDFLSAMNAEWVSRRRAEIAQTYGEALISLGRLMEQADRPREALGLFVRASGTNRQREDLARSIMVLYRRLGMHAEAINTYQRLEAELEATLGVSPARSLQDLVAEIEAESVQVA